MRYCVYCHTNRINGKKYIGITSQRPERRWSNGRGYVNNEYFYRSIQKYGWHNFQHEILYTDLSKEEAESIEINLISEYGCTDPQKGYNIEQGGNGTEKFTDEIKSKISKALTGHAVSDSTKRKISESKRGKESPKKGKKLSAEQIEKNQKSHIGQMAWNKGKVCGKEERSKFGGKPVKCVELNRVYASAHEAAEELNLDFSSICKCRKGKAKTTGGYHWVAVEAKEVPRYGQSAGS